MGNRTKLDLFRFGSPVYPLAAEFFNFEATAYDFTVSGRTTSVTPEPSSLALLGTGALGVIGAARRRFAA